MATPPKRQRARGGAGPSCWKPRPRTVTAWPPAAGPSGGVSELTAGAAKTCGELLRLFVLEARDRAEAEARSEGDETIRPEHLEAALAELLADFS